MSDSSVLRVSFALVSRFLTKKIDYILKYTPIVLKSTWDEINFSFDSIYLLIDIFLILSLF